MRNEFLAVMCVLAWMVAVAVSAVAAAAEGEPDRGKQLRPLAAQPLRLGEIKPTGWLLRQLEIQASGLGGHLDEFWPDVKDSSWIGGKAEGWERGPYWLDGFIPLAVQLDDARLKARAQRWIDHILKTQHDDGWLGPLKGNPDPNSRLKEYDVWPRFIVLKALTQWQEATGDKRIVPAMGRFLRRLDSLLDEKPIEEWARVRWADLSASIYWLYDRTHEPWLLKLAEKVRKQGLDWPKLARDYPFREKITRKHLEAFKQAAGRSLNDEFGATHGVNLAMGVKAAGVWFRQSDDWADRTAALSLLETLDRYHGQATGVFSCDEHVAGKHPSQGTELCAVVELMYSLETLLAIMPEVLLADRLESVAFNALPATFKDDMWAHQYDQQANQVVCKVSQERIYSNNGPDANVFGLEPSFGCCLANMHQGWPKFVSHLWMKSGDGGLTAMAYAPCEIKTRLGASDVSVKVSTEYPFNESIEIIVASSKPATFPIRLRIPAWTGGATLKLDGKTERPYPGTFHRIEREWSGKTTMKLTIPQKIRVERRFNDSVTVRRGPLVFALKVGQDWRKLRDRPPTADWEVHPTTAWNYGLVLDSQSPEKGLRVKTQSVGKIPFSSEMPAVRLFAKGRRIPGWELVKNAADAPPSSPASSSEAVEAVELIPYGCAKLRVTEIPVVSR